MHKKFMLKALEQARLGRGSCAPNPSVGAVVVQKGQIIASAFHQGAGSAHAEYVVLKKIPKNLQDITLYVTLEPCNHWGKTPPCVSAIIEYGVSLVIYAFRDPNPLVAVNDTPSILKAKGIKVIHFPLAEIDLYYRSYSFWIKHKRPWVSAKIAQSFDGKIAGPEGNPVTLSNQYCSRFTHIQRKNTDMILTTVKTIEQDDPLFTVRLDGLVQAKLLAILDRDLRLSPSAKVLQTALHAHIFHDAHKAVTKAFANCSYHPVAVKEGSLDLLAIIEKLGQLGLHDVWVEAGGFLFTALHNLSLVQSTYIYLVPTILGEKAIAAYPGNNFFEKAHTISWKAQGDNMIACLEWDRLLQL